MSSSPDTPSFLRVRNITADSNVSRAKVYRAIKDGHLAAVRLEGVLLIPVEAYRAWLATAVPVKE